MEHAHFAAKIEASADKVWDFVRWENLERMLEGGEMIAVEFDDRRAVVGATRKVTFKCGATICERLEAIDPGDRYLKYRIIDAGPFPIASYVGEVRVEPDGDSACTISMQCQFLPLGISADEWRRIYGEMQAGYVAFIGDRLSTAELSS